MKSLILLFFSVSSYASNLPIDMIPEGIYEGEGCSLSYQKELVPHYEHDIEVYSYTVYVKGEVEQSFSMPIVFDRSQPYRLIGINDVWFKENKDLVRLDQVDFSRGIELTFVKQSRFGLHTNDITFVIQSDTLTEVSIRSRKYKEVPVCEVTNYAAPYVSTVRIIEGRCKDIEKDRLSYFPNVSEEDFNAYLLVDDMERKEYSDIKTCRLNTVVNPKITKKDILSTIQKNLL